MNKLLNFSKQLTRIRKDEPLNFISMTIIVMLDIFILVNLFNGLDNQESTIAKTYDLFPYKYSKFIENYKVEQEKVELLVRFTYFDEKYKRGTSFKLLEYDKVDSSLYPVIDALNEVKKDQQLVIDLVEFSKLEKNIKLVKERDTEKEVSYRVELKLLEEKIRKNTRFINFWKLIDSDKIDLNLAAKRYDNAVFYRSLKVIGLQSLFIVPIFLAFLFWHKRSLKLGKEFQIFISTHLLVITSIPIFLKILETLYEIIPRNIIKELLELLSSLHLIALWNYFLILLAIGVAFLLIYLSQKKLFNKERITKKRYFSNHCIKCATKLKANSIHCYNCGTKQTKICKNCGKDTFVLGKFCINCGEKH